jgi:hypothetical protein
MLLASAGMALADGGVILKDMTSSVGINYARKSTPSREAWRAAELALSPIPMTQFFNHVVESAQKWHGAPGVALIDYDNDGDLDIYVTNGPGRANSLFKNMLKETGQLTFVDVAEEAGVALKNNDSTGVCFGDIDNDGFDDIYVVSSGQLNHLLHNNGNGTFTDITSTAGVGGDHRYAASCSMGDVNNDGLLDIAVANTYHPWTHRRSVFTSAYDPNDEQDYLFINTGNNVFTDASSDSGLESLLNVPDFGAPPGNPTFTWAVAMVDLNQDGFIDYMGLEDAGAKPQAQRGIIRYMKGDGTGHFTDESVPAKTNETGSFMGSTYSDFNCDGNMDFFVTDLGDFLAAGQNSRWFLGQADGTFVNPGVGDMVGTPFGWGASAFDYDNDGDDDIAYYGGVDLLRSFAHDNPGTLLQNTGSCTAKFEWDINAIERDHRDRIVEGVATGDLNNDGFGDIVTVSEIDTPNTPLFGWIPNVSGPHGTVFDPYAAINAIFVPAAGGVFVYRDPHFVDGSLVVEINSADNGNNWAQFKLMGTVGMIGDATKRTSGPVGRVNRDGIGSIVRFTPDGGKTNRRPVLGGSSYASEDSLVQTFGLAKAKKGTVEVAWPGGVHNRVYDVLAKERLTLPEIPCDFSNFPDGLGPRASGAARRALYRQCVDSSLATLNQTGVINRKYMTRLETSALRAYDDTHH